MNNICDLKCYLCNTVARLRDYPHCCYQAIIAVQWKPCISKVFQINWRIKWSFKSWENSPASWVYLLTHWLLEKMHIFVMHGFHRKAVVWCVNILFLKGTYNLKTWNLGACIRLWHAISCGLFNLLSVSLSGRLTCTQWLSFPTAAHNVGQQFMWLYLRHLMMMDSRESVWVFH